MWFQSVRDPHFWEGGLETGKSAIYTCFRHFQMQSEVLRSINKSRSSDYKSQVPCPFRRHNKLSSKEDQDTLYMMKDAQIGNGVYKQELSVAMV